MSRITLPKPDAGKTAQCAVQHGHVYVLGFDTSTVTFGRDNGDLAMLFEDGAYLLLRDFYHETQMGDLFLEMPDGALVSAHDIIEAMEFVPENFLTDNEPVFIADAGDGETSPHTPDLQAVSLAQPLSVVAQAGEDSFHPAGIRNEDSKGDHDTGIGFQAVCGLRIAPDYAVQIPHAGANRDDPAEALLIPEHDRASLFSNAFQEEASGEGFLSFAFSSLPKGDSSFASSYSLLDTSEENHAPRLSSHGEPQLDSIESSVSDAMVFFPHASKEPELLLLEDLLDTSMPELTANREHLSAFEGLFQSSQEEALSVRVDSFAFPEADHLNNSLTTADSAENSSDQLLLAFLRMGSF